MIKFSCNKCGHKLGVKDELAGKRGKCPGCGGIIVVPEKTILINFNCENCGEKISAPGMRAGTKGTCPKCKVALVVPAAHNLTLLDVREELRVQDQPTSQPSVSEDFIEQDGKEEISVAEENESAAHRNLPWFIDIFLYPTSTAGLTHLAIFIGVPFLVYFIRQLLGPFTLMLWLPSLIVNILIGLYMCWYFAECVRDSADGGIRAPEAFANADVGSMVEQCLYLAACYAIFMAPAFVYGIFADKTDTIFWILIAYGVFFFPMGLLAVVMFDSSSAFNPILWIGSIFSTFFQYCGLVLLIGGVVLAFRVLTRIGGPQAPEQISIGTRILEAAFSCLMLYLVFVLAHLLGRFYWRYQDKLNWEV
ncbi:MAG: hypothetical protein JSW47_05105 [Phycisphaerales bacterium]|nr:MAG: hypothetical protein JSW47_05105 [Phycisphaerales bacterium]